jgi:hypothetical protein
VLEYITTSDTIIGQDVIDEATRNGVVVVQRYLMYNPRDDVYYLSPAEALNEAEVAARTYAGKRRIVVFNRSYKTFAQSLQDLFGP